VWLRGAPPMGHHYLQQVGLEPDFGRRLKNYGDAVVEGPSISGSEE